jgi:hypothetical protein
MVEAVGIECTVDLASPATQLFVGLPIPYFRKITTLLPFEAPMIFRRIEGFTPILFNPFSSVGAD